MTRIPEMTILRRRADQVQPQTPAQPAASVAAPVRSSSARTGSWIRRASLVTVVSTLAAAGLAPAAHAATSYTATELTAEVKGNVVTSTLAITASAPTIANSFKMCVRTSNGGTIDFVGQPNTALNPTGRFTDTKTFPIGTYSYWGCLRVGTQWIYVGTPKSFKVTATTALSTSTETTMPTTSTKPNWVFSYGEDFSRPAPLGQFSKTYGRGWAGYVGVRNDSSRNGSYQPDKVLSVADGKLDMALGYDASTDLYNVAAPSPQPPAGVNGGSAEYSGIRTNIRFTSSNSMPGYKVAWMLWPSSYNWNDGEIDFPENSLSGGIGGFSHQANTGSPQLNTLWMQSDNTFFDGWHTATTEWIPGKSVEFFLDGVSVGKTTSNVPTKPMHWTLQTETALTAAPPAKTTSGRISIDWLTVESYQP